MGHDTDIHHRRPRSRGGGNNPENLSGVPVNYHQAWHKLFANLSPQEIAAIINDCWLDPDFYFVTIPRKKVQGQKHKRTLKVVCDNCGDRCQIEDVKTPLVRKLNLTEKRLRYILVLVKHNPCYDWLWIENSLPT